MRVYGIIPARLQSSRLPRKLLLNQTGKSVLQYTWESAREATLLDDVYIAADSPEVVDVAREFGARCELTGDHPSGTDRIAELARRHCADADVLVNIQGDEPEIDPAAIDTLVGLLANDPNAEMATLSTTITTQDQLEDPSCTKVVCSADGRALYFSRCPIPFCRDQDSADLLKTESPWRLHLGIYAYRREFLQKLTQLPPSPLERLEKLEQLRALEQGATIRVANVAHASVGIDTPEDYARFVERQSRKAA